LTRSLGGENSVTSRLMMGALGHRNYRLFFAGQGLSLVGTWMQRIAIAWLVYRLTGSAFLLGFVGFAGQIPTFILASFAGVFIDRSSRYRILLVTQILATVQSALLAFLTLTGHVAIWHIFLLSFSLGVINAFDMPARQSFVIDMVEGKEDLPNAIALNSMMVNGARLVGPALAGLAVAGFGEGVCFLLNALSFVTIIVALLAMKIKHVERKPSTAHPWHDLKEGYRYAFGFVPIRYLLLLLGLVSIMGMPFQVLMPVFAKDVLHGGPHTLGFLMGTLGIGALVAAGYLATRKSVVGLGRVTAVACLLFGLGLVAFSLSHQVVLSFIAMFFAGLGMMGTMASCNTIIQTVVDDEKRGRVMGFYTMAIMGMSPFGSFMAGSLASHIGAPNTVILGGISCVAASLLFTRKLPAFRKAVHPIYVARNIIPASDVGDFGN
jgi:MFS family permease